MTFEPSRLRGDLVVTRQEAQEGVRFVVKDPTNGRFFRLGEAEHCITQQLDGGTPLEVIRQQVEQKFGAALSAETLMRFLETLRRNGLLEQGHTDSQAADRRRRVRGSLLYLRLAAFDPDRLLSRMIGGLKFFFTPYFLVFSGAVLLTAFYVAIAEASEIRRAVAALYRFDALLLA